MLPIFRKRVWVALGAVVLAATTTRAAAQQPVTVTGRITSEAGSPVEGAVVSIRSLSIGASTRADGGYELVVPGSNVSGQSVVLDVRRIGLKPDTAIIVLSPGTTITHNFVLSANPLQLGEVVITGAGTQTTAERIGTVRTSVDSSLIIQSNEPNIVNALAGKAAGVNVASQSGSPGASASIVIRGLNTIQGTGQPLFVVDGTPIDNTTFSTSGNTGSTDTPNRASDINPDDIESVEILKSAAAAAIYGARAGQGVVLITTKQGHAGETRYTLRSSVRRDEVNRTIPLQRTYGQGTGGTAATCTRLDCTLTGSSWGARLAPGTPTYDHARDIYTDGATYDNALTVAGGNNRTTFFLSGAATNQNGITVGNHDEYNRYSARLKATHQLATGLTLNANIAYVDARGQFLQKGSNTSGVNLGNWRSPPEFNNFDYIDPATGLHRSYRFPNPSAASQTTSRIYDNPLFVINDQDNTQQVGRSFGNVGADWLATPWLTLHYQIGADYASDERLETLPMTSAGYPQGQLIRGTLVNNQLDQTLTAQAIKSWRDGWDTRFTLGGNLNSREYSQVLVTGQNLIAPEPFNLQNTTDYTTNDFHSLIRGQSVFGQLQQAIGDQLFLTGTVRDDGFSTFGSSQRYHWFPSGTAAWTFSNAFNPGNVLSTGRLRVAFGEAGTEPGVYITNGFYSGGFLGGSYGDALQASQGGRGGLFTSGRRPQSDLGPEVQKEFETGLDLGFWNDRSSLSLTYYNRRNEDVIFDLPLPFSTGFTVQAANAGTIRNAGFEAQWNITPYQTAHANWDLGFTYARNRNKVLELRGTDAVDLPTGGFFTGALVSAVEGHPIGVFRSYDFVRCRAGDATNFADIDGDGTPDDINALCGAAGAANGSVYLGPDGFPIDDPTLRVVGDPNPRWTGSVRTGFQYGPFKVTGLVDIRRGGDIWNGTKGALYNFGTHRDTEIRGETVRFGENFIPGNPKNGHMDVFGPGKGKDVVIDESWYTGLGSGFGPVASQFMEDAGYVKLREIAVEWTFKGDWLKRTLGLGALDLRFAGRNLATWTDYTGIDPETNLAGAEVAAQNVDYFNNPQTRSWILTVGLHK